MMSVAVDREVESSAEDMSMKRYSFTHSFRAIYYFSRVFGLLPWSINFDSERLMHEPMVRVFDVLWFLILICGYSFVSYNSYHRMKVSNDSGTILIFGGHMHMIFRFFFGIVAMAMDLCNRHKIVNILNMFNDFDQNVSNNCELIEIVDT